MRQPNWSRILTILLVILASYAIVYITGSILLRFAQALLLFVLGAMLAYLLTPLVNSLETAFRIRWVAILLAYVFVAVGLLALGVMLFTPFVQQSQSLIDSLQNPSSNSLVAIKRVETESKALHQQIASQVSDASQGSGLRRSQVSTAERHIAQLILQVRSIRNGTVSGRGPQPHQGGTNRQGKLPPNPPSQTRVPPSYVNSVLGPLTQLSTEYDVATTSPNSPDVAGIRAASRTAKRVNSASASMYHTMATTPILLLHAQVWADNHNVGVDLHSKFGQAANQISNQGTYLLDNAITIVSETVNILLNLVLILIISVYLVSDGQRIVRGIARIVPSDYREHAWFFITSLDDVLGGYVRGQLFLSALAGVLGGGGAALLGVPFPLLIGLMTFVLESIPVIGPMVAAIPPVVISLFFNSVPTTILMLAWFLIFQQLVTNVLGPRVMGMAVGIHPLEALLAVLVGYPLGGLLGAFLAVPIAGIIHIVVREAYAYFALGQALPTAPVPAAEEEEAAGAPGAAGTKPREVRPTGT